MFCGVAKEVLGARDFWLSPYPVILLILRYMLAKIYIVLLFALTLVSVSVLADSTQSVVVGYLPEYRLDPVVPERLTVVTDLVFFSIEAPADGRLSTEPVGQSVLQTLRSIQQVSGSNLLLCVGGWKRSKGFPSMTMEAGTRQRFIKGLLVYCQTQGFNGVDYDWEHPKNAEELTAYSRLLQETAEAFHPHGLLVTVAQANWQDLGVEAYAAVDRVHLMSYDQPFPQATFDKAKAEVEQLVQWGCPLQKIALGLPFYGRNAQRETRTYQQLIRQGGGGADSDIIDGFAFNARQRSDARCGTRDPKASPAS